ncbi:MAG: flagellar basal body rod protein FlgC [Desulfobacula sp. RIFOXYA12_FULL_46_16]|jgi:flagellar basal-body rod protein FlgC|nr:MAG: flagellar basal body rod protein FlgC [Deltaproteobacteria bacterium RIFOXYC2_FULL_48_10]OGR20716.1 MAG: flagellar basal body rod protein FlgC [Desulfobacula sp. RIFOXYA12_FULL_46_16]OGR58958.1 MAG: flagellar basal body rod protein FlgC [Desulfobacula sp. RIFOXYB2_FULL_45_6]
MDLLNASKISGTALAAHRTKLNVIAENLANVDTTRTKEGGPYRRKMVVFKAEDIDSFKSVVEKKQEKQEKWGIELSPIEFDSEKKPDKGTGVNVDQIIRSQEDFRLIYNPAHPDADPDTGYVKMPNVDHLTEIADMLVAKRSYEASATALSATKDMILKALEIGK